MTTDLRKDLALIASQIEPGSRLLDVGCADGSLLRYLRDEKKVEGRGIELDVANVNACVEKGLFAVQGDADTDLGDYADHSFDYVVLSRTLQAVQRPKAVLGELLRIGRRAIVTIPNFGHWKVRTSLMFRGRMPMTSHLSKMWYETENIHFCTIQDMFNLIAECDCRMETFVPVGEKGDPLHMGPRLANIAAAQALFVLSSDY